MSYSSVIYKLKRGKKPAEAILKQNTPDNEFPDKIAKPKLVEMLVRGQAICFKDGDIEKENTNRFLSLFETRKEDNPTIAVIAAMGFLEEPNNILSANDMGSLTIQRGKIDELTGNTIDSTDEVLWINEVCRSLFNKEKVPSSDGPIPIVMNLAEHFARNQGESMIFLMVEKNQPNNGGEVLKQYYGPGYKRTPESAPKGGYGYVVQGEDEEYWYMGKDLSIQSGMFLSPHSQPTTGLDNLEEDIEIAEGGEDKNKKKKKKTRRHRHKKKKHTRKRKRHKKDKKEN